MRLKLLVGSEEYKCYGQSRWVAKCYIFILTLLLVSWISKILKCQVLLFLRYGSRTKMFTHKYTLFIVNDAYHPERAFEKLLWKLRRSTWSIKTIDMERPFPSAGRSQLICPGPVSSCCCCKKDYPLTYLHFFTNVIQQICGALSPVFHDNCCCVSHSGGSYRERRTRGIYCTYTI